MELDELIEHVKSLSPREKIILCDEVFGDASCKDNTGQRVIYTAIIFDYDLKDFREMTEKDFDG